MGGHVSTILPLRGNFETKSIRKGEGFKLEEKQGWRQEDNPAMKQKSWLPEVNSHTSQFSHCEVNANGFAQHEANRYV